jgi:hypothetical protein
VPQCFGSSLASLAGITFLRQAVHHTKTVPDWRGVETALMVEAAGVELYNAVMFGHLLEIVE